VYNWTCRKLAFITADVLEVPVPVISKKKDLDACSSTGKLFQWFKVVKA
jgi:hypothetical protein